MPQMLLRSLLILVCCSALTVQPHAGREARAAEAARAATPARQPVVTAIGAVRGASGTQITISGDADLAYEYVVIEGKSLVVDIPGATSAVWPADQRVDSEFVGRVRAVEQTGEKPGVRVAFDLRKQAPFTIRPGSHQIVVSFAEPSRAGGDQSAPDRGTAAPAASAAPATASRDSAAAAPPAQPAPRATGRFANRVSDVTVEFRSNELRIFVATASKPAYRRLPGRTGLTLRFSIPDADMAAPYPRVTDFAHVSQTVQRVAAWPESGSVVVEVDLIREVPEPRVSPTDRGLEIVIEQRDSSSVSATQAALPSPAFVEMPLSRPVLPGEIRNYSKKRIYLHFEDVEITDILTVLSDAAVDDNAATDAKINIITWEGVKGKRTVKLDDVPWDQALELLCETHAPRLVQVRESDNVIRITTYEQFLKEQAADANKKAELEKEKAKAQQEKANADAANAKAEQARNDMLEAQIKREELKQKQLEAEAAAAANQIELVSRTFRISYGDVVAIAERIVTYSHTTPKVAEKAGTAPDKNDARRSRPDFIFEINKDAKTIFVHDYQESIDLMALVVGALDVPPPAVMVEARIVEVNNSAKKSIGIQWGAAGVKDAAHGNATNYAFPNSISLGGNAAQGSGVNPGTYMVNLPASSSVAGIGLTLGHIANTFSLDVQLTAMEGLGNTKILSNPKVLVLQNKEAIINVGRRLPQPKVSSEGDTTVEWLDVGILLKVKPEITNDGKVIMQVMIEKSEIADAVSTPQGQMYSLTSSRAETRVIIGDGETSVIGGLFIQTKVDSSSGVPGLSKIPFLGHLFRSDTTANDRNELMIFITPKLVNAAAAAAARETAN